MIIYSQEIKNLIDFIMTFHEVILTNERTTLKKFASRIFQAFSSNFGGNFLSRGVQKNHQMTVLFYFFNGITIWIAYRASITAGLSQKLVKLPLMFQSSKNRLLFAPKCKDRRIKSGFLHAKPAFLVFIQNNLHLT